MAQLHSEVDSSRVPRRGPYSQAVRLGDLLFVAGQRVSIPRPGRRRGQRSSSKRARRSTTFVRSSRTLAAAWSTW